MALKISKAIGIIARLRHFLPASVLLNIYNSLIHPYLSYGLVVWDQTSKTNLDKILLLQKRTQRLIYFSNNSEHAIPLFLRSNIPPIDMLCYKSVALLMHDINNDLAPRNLKNLFTRLASIHSCNTRAAAAGKFNVIHSRTKQQNQSFSNFRARIWNKIPELVKSKPKQLFRKHLHTKLLQFLLGVNFILMSIILLIN